MLVKLLVDDIVLVKACEYALHGCLSKDVKDKFWNEPNETLL